MRKKMRQKEKRRSRRKRWRRRKKINERIHFLQGYWQTTPVLACYLQKHVQYRGRQLWKAVSLYILVQGFETVPAARPYVLLQWDILQKWATLFPAFWPMWPFHRCYVEGTCSPLPLSSPLRCSKCGHLKAKQPNIYLAFYNLVIFQHLFTY